MLAKVPPSTTRESGTAMLPSIEIDSATGVGMEFSQPSKTRTVASRLAHSGGVMISRIRKGRSEPPEIRYLPKVHSKGVVEENVKESVGSERMGLFRKKVLSNCHREVSGVVHERQGNHIGFPAHVTLEYHCGKGSPDQKGDESTEWKNPPEWHGCGIKATGDVVENEAGKETGDRSFGNAVDHALRKDVLSCENTGGNCDESERNDCRETGSEAFQKCVHEVVCLCVGRAGPRLF